MKGIQKYGNWLYVHFKQKQSLHQDTSLQRFEVPTQI